jgi:hypothetical protein
VNPRVGAYGKFVHQVNSQGLEFLKGWYGGQPKMFVLYQIV